MVDTKIIKAELIMQEKSMKEMADHVGINIDTAYRWMRNPELITLDGAAKISEFLGWSPEKASEIFLSNHVQ